MGNVEKYVKTKGKKGMYYIEWISGFITNALAFIGLYYLLDLWLDFSEINWQNDKYFLYSLIHLGSVALYFILFGRIKKMKKWKQEISKVKIQKSKLLDGIKLAGFIPLLNVVYLIFVFLAIKFRIISQIYK